MKFASILITGCLAALFFLVVPNSVGAQESTSTSIATEAEFVPIDDTAQGLVLSVNRSEDDLSEVAAFVTIIDQEAIQNSGAKTVVELLEDVAGLSVTSTSSPAQAQVSLRGFGENGFGRTLVLIDGIPLNSADMRGLDWLTVPLARIERIEVVRGSASSLYGNNAIGGVINIITKRAKEDSSTDIKLSIGSNWSHQESARISFYKDLIGLDIFAENVGTEGWRERSGFSSSRGGADLVLDLDKSLSLRLSASVSDTSYEMPGAIDQATFLVNPRKALNYEDSGEQRSFDSKALLSWKASDVFSLQVPLAWNYGQLTKDTSSFSSYSATQTKTFDARPQASFQFGGEELSLRINSGADLRIAGIENQNYMDVTRTSVSSSNVVFQNTLGLYINADLSIDNVFSIGARVREDLVWHGRDEANGFGDALVYGFSLLANPINEIKLFARFDRLFRYPFLDERYSLYSATVWDLRPETGFNLEAGTSFALSEILSFDISGYLLDLVDEIAWVNGPGPDGGNNENIGSTRRLGIDSQISFKPIKELELTAGYSFVDARFVGGDNDGSLIPLVSSHKLTSKVTINLPFGLSLAPKLTYVGPYYAGGVVPNSLEPSSERFLLDVQARFNIDIEQGQLAIIVEAKNLLDIIYASQAYSSSVYPGDGRSFAVSLSYQY